MKLKSVNKSFKMHFPKTFLSKHPKAAFSSLSNNFQIAACCHGDSAALSMVRSQIEKYFRILRFRLSPQKRSRNK